MIAFKIQQQFGTKNGFPLGHDFSRLLILQRSYRLVTYNLW